MKKFNKFFAASGITGLLLFISGSVFSQMRWGDRWHGPGMMYGYGWNWAWVAGSLVFIMILVIGIIFLIRWNFASIRFMHGRTGDSALEILRCRYAKGEINKEEFEQKKRDIE